jgi:dCTP deaminase
MPAPLCRGVPAQLFRSGATGDAAQPDPVPSGQAVLDDATLAALHAREPLVSGEAVISDGLGFSVDLRPEAGDLVGFRAKPHTGVVDLDLIGHYRARDFWEEIRTDEGRIILDPGAFYILVSREAVTIPPDYAAEMAPYLAMVGEFRVHYAGFFDPGFGHAAAGGAGSRGVLEVRCHEAPFVLEHGQVVGRWSMSACQSGLKRSMVRRSSPTIRGRD